MLGIISAYRKRFHNTGQKTKVARVATAVKMYRRALMTLQNARKAPSVFHGTKPQYFKDIVRTGTIKPVQGTHGHGSYFWKARPRQGNMAGPKAHGFIAPQTSLGKFTPPKSKFPFAPDRKYMAVRPGPFKLPQKAYVSAPPADLRAVRPGIKQHRLRQMDSAIWNRAEADMAAKRLGETIVTPSKQELVRLLRRKTQPPKFKYTRARPGTKEADEFLDSYDAVAYP